MVSKVNVALFLFTLMLSLGSSGREQDDLRISIARIETADSKPSDPEFAVTLENPGDSDLVVLLGAVVGSKLYPHAINLLLTDQGGHISNLRYRGPVRIGGRMDPYVVGLPSRATYVLQVSLAQFTSPYTGEGRTRPPATSDELDPGLPSGRYTIQATLQEPGERNLASDVYGNRLMNLWMGSVSSNVLHLVVGGFVQPQEGVDFTGRWILEPSSSASAETPSALSVRQSLATTNARGDAMQPFFKDITIEREVEGSTRAETHQIGVVGGVVSATSGGRSWGSHEAVMWDANTLVIESGSFTGERPETGVWSERREAWSLDSGGRLHVAITTRSSSDAPRSAAAVYRRE